VAEPDRKRDQVHADAPRRRIEIGATKDEREHIYYAKDNGVEFDSRHADRLFRPFERLHRASKFEGNGIGLANVRRIKERHSGRVWTVGELDSGARFYFLLPNREIQSMASSPFDHIAPAPFGLEA
jgi:light-regulated signal transduction histidine kinase (bacteriophytochrome)